MITLKQQRFLLELLIKHAQKKGYVTRKEIIKKPIFSNDSDFFSQIRELKEFGYIENETYDNYKTRYRLTMNGWAFANIIAKQKNSESRFKKLAVEIRWIP